TPMLRQLPSAYHMSTCLFPGNELNRTAIDSTLLDLDTTLGLLARRLGYTQAILECPNHLTTLFLGERAFGLFRLPGVRRIAGWVLGMALMQRFDMHKAESSGIYEALEEYLLPIAKRLAEHRYLVGDTFSAADLSLAALLRPLTIVPFFAEHPGLKSLFDWHRSVVATYGGEALSAYQLAIDQARTKQPPFRRWIRKTKANMPFTVHGNHARNDQRSIWTWGFAMAPFHFIFGIRANKVRSAVASESIR
ncbi:MAG: glutathione S-transferase C-terminal domain-containing protein, partial [Pseudomonadota bacterium]